MTRCVYCKAETDTYEGDDVPICIECSDAQESKRNVRAILTHNLREATAHASKANEAFQKIVSAAPSGIPYVDSTQRIHDASAALTIARAELLKAHNRLNNFLARGTLPKDFELEGESNQDLKRRIGFRSQE